MGFCFPSVQEWVKVQERPKYLLRPQRLILFLN